MTDLRARSPQIVKVGLRDSRIARSSVSLVKVPRTKKQCDARRGCVAGFSRKSRTRAQLAVRNIEALSYFATLTYEGSPPRSGVVLKDHVTKLRRRLCDRKFGIFWKIEFCKSGRPHLHLMLTHEIKKEVLCKIWSEITGCVQTPALVHVSAIRSRDCVNSYIVKDLDDSSNKVPPRYKDCKRLWGYAGPGAKPTNIAEFEGPPREIAKLTRIVKKLLRIKRKRAPRRDNGMWSFTAYNVGGGAVARALTKYAMTLPDVRVARDENRRVAVRKTAGAKDFICSTKALPYAGLQEMNCKAE